LNNYLKERRRGSNKSRIQIYEAVKRRKRGKSPIAKEEIRKGGRSKKEAIPVDDLPPAIIDSSFNMLAMENIKAETGRKSVWRKL
jgi:hypothetical protein